MGNATHLAGSGQVHIVNAHARAANHLEPPLGRLNHLAADLQLVLGSATSRDAF